MRVGPSQRSVVTFLLLSLQHLLQVHCVANSDQIELSEAIAEFVESNSGSSAHDLGLALGDATALHLVSEAAAVDEEITTESSIAQAESGNVNCHFICFVER